MGLFNNYTKEGKGVEKDAPKPIRPIYFFELFFRAFSKMIQLNLLYVVTSVPIWIFILFIGNFLLSSLAGTNELLVSLSYVAQIMINPLTVIGLLLICMLWGPSTAGATYLYINYATEMPVFLMSDYFEHFKKNFKQASLLMMINVIAFISLFITWIMPIFPEFGAVESVKMLYMLRWPSLIIFTVLTFVNFYAYPIMVMFKMKFTDIIKNSILFALGRLPWNILTLVLALIPSVLLASFVHPIVLVIAFVLILYSFGGFMTVFSVYPTIEKYMLIPAKEVKDENETEEIIIEN